MSWVEKLPSGRHKAVYRDDDGQRFSKSFNKKADARRWLAAADTDRARGHWVDPRGGAMLLSDWAVLWFASRNVRTSTHTSDQPRYRNHPVCASKISGFGASTSHCA